MNQELRNKVMSHIREKYDVNTQNRLLATLEMLSYDDKSKTLKFIAYKVKSNGS